MLDQFLGRVPIQGGYQYGVVNMSMFGSGLITLLVVAALYAIAVLFSEKGRGRRRAALAAALMLAGFGLYQFELFVVYAYFIKTQPGQLPSVFDYARYLSSYFAGWMALGLVLLGAAARRAAAKHRRGAERGALLLACFVALRLWALMRPGYTVLDYPDSAFSAQRAIEADAAHLAAKLPEEARIFFVCQGGNAQEWYQYGYHLMGAAVVDHSITGGRALTPGEAPLGAVADYLAEHGCNYILIVDLDDVFTTSYANLFERGLADWPGRPALYVRAETGRYRLTPDS